MTSVHVGHKIFFTYPASDDLSHNSEPADRGNSTNRSRKVYSILPLYMLSSLDVISDLIDV